MATEIVEFYAVKMSYGGVVPVYPLPPVRSTTLALGTPLTILAPTSILMITPDEDVRIAVTTDGSTPAPDATSMLLRAGVRYDFSAKPGMKLQGVAA